jgi:ribosomal protein L35AE/L33A
MKKLTFIALALVAMATTFTSCKKDTTNDATISLAGDTGYTAVDATVAPGATIKIKWTATCTTTNMAFVSITRDDSPLTGWIDKEIPSASKATYIDEASLTVPASGGPFTYAVIIEDKDKAELISKSIVITLGASTVINLKAEITGVKIMGTLADGSGNSSCATADGSVYSPKTISSGDVSKVDFIYVSFKGMYCPSSLSSADAGFASTLGTAWSTKNTTNFLKVTDLDYTAATYATVLAKASTATATSTSALSVNDIVVFKTAAGKVGAFKVTDVHGTAGVATDYVTINIKVQE